METSLRSENIYSLPVLYVIFFVSGLAALLYQLLWQRALFGIYGTNTESVTIVVDSILDRKSTRLNSSHVRISYAVFCLKKKKKKKKKHTKYLFVNTQEQYRSVDN